MDMHCADRTLLAFDLSQKLIVKRVLPVWSSGVCQNIVCIHILEKMYITEQDYSYVKANP